MARFLALALIVLVASQAFATDYTWLGAGTQFWNAPANWNPSTGYPSTLSDNVVIPTPGGYCKISTEPEGPGNFYQLNNMQLGDNSDLNRNNIIVGLSFGTTSGLEFASGAVITKYSYIQDTINCALKLDGPVTFNTTSPNLLLTYKDLYLDGPLSGTGGVIKDGPGALLFNQNVPSTNTGQMWIKAGRVYLGGTAGMQQIGPAGVKMTGTGKIQWSSIDHIADNAPIEMGDNSSLVNANCSDLVGVLTCDTGTPSLWGSAGGIFHFANSSGATWAADTVLGITQWGSSTMPAVYFGNDNTGLTADQLSHIQFIAQDSVGNFTTRYPVAFDSSNTGRLIAVTHTYWDADFNHDLVVNYKDYIILEGSFGKSGMTNAQGDANNDGFVNYKDYIVLEGQFGKTTTPEPATLGLLIAGGLILVRRRRVA